MANFDEIVYLNMVNNLQEEQDQPQFNRRRRLVRQIDPFELSYANFRKYYRLTKDMVRNLINILDPYLSPTISANAIDKQTKVLTALRFYAAGSYQKDVGISSYGAISQSSTCRCIEEVTNALNQEEIVNRWIKFPRTIVECETLRQKFSEKFNFPGVIGLIDCTHVAIVPPRENEHLYVNRKHYHSINVQLICDSDLRILNVFANYPGSTHDSFIWQNSRCNTVLRNLYRTTQRSFFLLGDTGYPLKPWLLTPFKGNPNPGTPEAEYNSRHKQTRSLIERCNGVLKMRWRCLLKDRVLHYHPIKACRIIKACIVLHNMCVEANLGDEDILQDLHNFDLGWYDNENNADRPMDEVRGRVNPDLAAGRRMRNFVMNRL